MSAPAHLFSDKSSELAPFTVRAGYLEVAADHRFGFVDLTELIEIELMRAEIDQGACIAFSTHTTCALVINEWEDGALEDLGRRLQSLFAPESYYAHDDLTLRTRNLTSGERRNGHAHVAQMIMGGASLTIPVRDGALLLGRWQSVILVELDQPRPRTIALQLMGTSAVPVPPEGRPSMSLPAP